MNQPEREQIHRTIRFIRDRLSDEFLQAGDLAAAGALQRIVVLGDLLDRMIQSYEFPQHESERELAKTFILHLRRVWALPEVVNEQ